MPTTSETWKAATTAPGLSPPREVDMTMPAIDAWASWWQGRQEPDFIAQEIVAPHGIADLAAVQFDRGVLRDRAHAGIGATDDLGALRVIMASRRATRSVNELVQIVGLGPSGVRRAVRIGLDAGALTEVGERRFKTHPAWKPAGQRIVAVELKRTDWQRAIRQLWAYQGWASAAWLVLGQRPPITALEALHGTGIGLAYLDEGAAMRTILRPKSRRRLTGIWSVWTAEQSLAHALAAGFDPSLQSTKSGPARWGDVLALPAG